MTVWSFAGYVDVFPTISNALLTVNCGELAHGLEKFGSAVEIAVFDFSSAMILPSRVHGLVWEIFTSINEQGGV